MDHRVALVTGAGRGIGRAIALTLGRQGCTVCVNYAHSRQAALETVQSLRSFGTRAELYRADVADSAAVAGMVAQIRQDFGPVSLLVNNAGIAGQALFQDLSDAEWSRFLAVNLTGPRNTIRSVLPDMIRAQSGCIVNIASIWGLRGASCEVAYACTKAGVIAMTRSLALELAPSHIRVNCVAPGVIDTDMCRPLGEETLNELAGQTPLGRLGTPEDIAAAVAFLASDQASFLTGQVLTADGGFTV